MSYPNTIFHFTFNNLPLLGSPADFFSFESVMSLLKPSSPPVLLSPPVASPALPSKTPAKIIPSTNADSFFTIPISLSATSNQTGNTQFAGRLGRSNLTYLLDNTPSITAFVPSDAAFAALGNYTPTSAQIASQLSNHIVTNQVLYLPRLVHGARYHTKAGNEISVTVKRGRYFINDAEISQPDLILENGVAHIINKVKLFLFHPAFQPISFPVPTLLKFFLFL